MRMNDSAGVQKSENSASLKRQKKVLYPDHEKSKTAKPGFLNIFRWFSKEKTRSRSSANLDLEICSKRSENQSNPSNESLFIPLKHSVSADNADELMKVHCSTTSNSITYSSANNSTFHEQRSKSVIGSPSSNRSISDFSAFRAKKRHAPGPPSVHKLNSSFNPFHRSFDSNSLPDENELTKTHSEGFIYSKFKRKAPQPPNASPVSKTFNKEKNNELNCVIRPSSTFSNVSSLSYSTSSTLQSTTCSEDGSSNCSEASKCNPLFPILGDKEPMSPRPWYKRKSSKINKEKKKSVLKSKEVIYDMLMPDIQYSRPKTDAEMSSPVLSGQFKDSNRLSFLSTISDLDRAAVEHIQREKAQKQAAKIEHDQTFYKVSSTLILNQEHIMPSKKDVALTGNLQIKNLSSDPIGTSATYDNLQFKTDSLTSASAAYESSKEEVNGLLAGNSNGLEFMSHSELWELQNMGINYDEYLEEIRKEINGDQLSASNAPKETPLQKAVFDPELFYQLAKDAKVTCGAKLSKLQNIETSSKKYKHEHSNINAGKSPVSKRSPKNFGMRMNNFFTPDVSIILETSESVTSSNTTNTPAEDFAPAASFNVDSTSDFMSISSDLHSELRINTCDLQEIIENFAGDFRRKDGDKKLDSKENISKADKIREEILLLREKDNFLAWQKAMQEIDYSSKNDLAISTEKKKKWICDACTLVNQPWRLHCEACGTLRPPNPKRVNDDQPLQMNIKSSDLPPHLSQDIVIPSASGNSDMKVIKCSNWEKELQSYIQIFDGEANNIKQIDIGSVRNQLFNSQAVYSNDDLCSSYRRAESLTNESQYQQNSYIDDEELGAASTNETVTHSSSLGVQNKHDVELQHVRNARLRRFEQIQKKFDLCQGHEKYSNDPTLNNCGTGDNTFDMAYNSQIEEAVDAIPSTEGKYFYKNDYKKSQILKPSGAVKSVVSIFNQLDQLNQTVTVDKSTSTKIVKRKPCGTSQSFKDFEKLFNNADSFYKEAQSVSRCVSPIKADIDIASAINKFDEMAARAEISKISKPQPKTTKWKPKFCNINFKLVSPSNSSPANIDKIKFSNGNDSNNDINSSGISKYSCQASTSYDIDLNGSDYKASTQEFRESVIKDGILYTTGESRKRSRSMSIGSGTFELFTAKDFANIEAHHSRKPSPINGTDALTSSELGHPLMMPELASFNSDNLMSVGEDIRQEVVRLSQDLTEANGHDIYKVNMVGKDNQLGESNTKMSNILLRRLEDAISEGRHSEASVLANDLAKFKLLCSGKNLSDPLTVEEESAIQKSASIQKTESRNIHSTGAVSKDSSYRTSSEGSITPVTSESSSVARDFVTNITEDDFISLNGTEYSHDSESGCESGDVIKRTMKIDPSRREVKSDFVNRITSREQNCSSSEDKSFTVKMYVEDKSSHQGPIAISVSSSMKLVNLKKKVSEDFGFPYEVQRWILGRLLADDDSKNLSDYNVTANGCPIFLYLVAPEVKRSLKPSKSNKQQNGKKENELKQQKRTDEQKQKSKLRLSIQTLPVIQKPNENSNTKEHFVPRIGTQFTSLNTKVVDQTNSSVKSPTCGVNDTASSDIFKAIPNVNNGTKSEFESTYNGWVCPRCTLVNPMPRPGCEACTMERPRQIFENEAHPDTKMNLSQAMRALESQGCVPNLEQFECPVCFAQFDKGEGVILRDCLHQFCRDCLTYAIKYTDTAAVKCPFSNRNYSCQFSLQQREIRDLLSDEEYRKHLDQSVKEAAGTMKNVFYCKTPDCKGFCQFEDNVNVFNCDVCNKINCLTCQAQHEGSTCKQYQDELANKQDEGTLKTKQFFEDIIRRGDGIFCPQCSVMLVRKWGCDWMRCPMCKTEICWVTRGPRWGPGGQGDLSGGCKCGVNGRKCHPKCTYCH